MISVIIPIYNAGKVLERMLKSIQVQTYKELEVIMINDGSFDHSRDICKKFEKEDKRFHYYWQKNQGVSIARNNGLKLATGSYISFLDADDVIDSNYFEELLLACQLADIAICDVKVEREGKIVEIFTHEEGILNQVEAINQLLIRKNINSGPCAKLFRRDVVGDWKFPLLKTYEDMVFNLEIFCRADRISVTNKTAYHYLENSAGAMSAMLKAPSYDVIIATDRLMGVISSRKDLCPECCYTTLSHLLQYAFSMVFGNLKIDWEFIMKTRKLYKKYMKQIWTCSAFTWKEKWVFIFFVNGWAYRNGKWVRMQKKG